MVHLYPVHGNFAGDNTGTLASVIKGKKIQALLVTDYFTYLYSHILDDIHLLPSIAVKLSTATAGMPAPRLMLCFRQHRPNKLS